MPTFIYKAKDGPDRTVEGELKAVSRHEASAMLDRKGYIPVWVREQDKGAGRGQRAGWGRIRSRDITIFTRQLAGLLKSGVPILKALSVIAEQTDSGALRGVVRDLAATVRDGNTVSEGLSRHPALFSGLYVDMVRAGESGGVLDSILLRLSENREREDETKRKVKSAAAYPALILSVGVLTVIMLLTFFMPRIAGLFRDAHSLPAPTKALMSISAFMSRYWYWLAGGLALFAAFVKRMGSSARGRSAIDSAKLRIPFVGRMLTWSDVAAFARTLALLLRSGIPVDRALELGAGAMRNKALKDEIAEVRRSAIDKGATLSEGLARAPHLPAFVASMTAVGEESGRIETSMDEIARYYESEVEYRTRLATSMLEPALILAVGAIVGFIVVAMLLPVFEMGTGL